MPQRGAALAPLLALLAFCAATLPARADPDAIWRIVHDACVPHAEAGQGPSPCEAVDIKAGGEASGVAILKDMNGATQMLAIPTRKISGIEDPQLLAPDAPPVFAEAWAAKTLIDARLGETLPREAIAIAVNSKWMRSQQQLHIHVDCLRADVEDALKAYAPSLDDSWRPMTVALNGRKYLARRLASSDLADAEPVKLLAEGVADAKANMGAWTLAAVGESFDGKPGFILLADVFSFDGGGHAEDLQDHNCAIAKNAP